MISRRDFLLEGTAALAAVAVAPVPLRLGRPDRAKRVLVLGAGAAGLAAAYELDRAGHDVLVFEAKTIPGGRIHTLRAPFADGLYAEAGALFLSSDDPAVAYGREFDLPLVEVSFRQDLGSVVHVAGERIELGPDRPVHWPIALNPDEADQPLPALLGRYHYSPIAGVSGGLEGLNAADYPRPSHLEYDDLSLADFWRRNGASEGAIRIMRLRYFDLYGDGIESVSALQLMRERASFLNATAAYRIFGGNDLLPRAFAERLGGRIRYGSPVVAIRQDDDGVELAIEDRSGRHEVRGDYAISTLPFQILRNIPVAPAFPQLRMRAIHEIRPTSITRVYLQCRRRFWEDDGQDGTAVTDLPIQQVYHSTAGQPGERGILESFTAGERARDLAAMTPDRRLDTVQREMTKVHPRLPELVEGGASYSWDDDRWARGDSACFGPGQIREFLPYIQQPEGRIHFAGDVIGGIPAYVRSAMMSARAAAERIARAP